MHFRTTLTFAAFMFASSAAYAQRPAEQLEWLSGCWEMKLPGGAVIHEMWLPPAGGMLLGVSRTVRGDSVTEFEQMRIHERAGELVFTAQPSGQRTADFTATAVSAVSVTFENPLHDFPQRVIYRAIGADSLGARVEGTRNGNARGFDFNFARIPCTQTPAGS